MNVIRRNTLKERTYAEVKRALLTGRFAPGEAVTLGSLAEELQVGVTPVREAVQVLVADGALVSLSNGRFRVPLLTRRAFDELFDIRQRLEGMAVALAAERATKATLRTIGERLEAWSATVGRQTPEEMIEANYQFHFAVYEAADAPHLLSIIDSLWLRFSPILIYPLTAPAARRAAYIAINDNFHALLIDGLGKKDPVRAESILRENISGAADWYRDHYPF